ncbi:MAG: DUF1304 domain-containing protein [Bdellovibrionia bacterium]
MNVAAVLISLVAVEHVYFAVLEMYLWTKPKGLKAFNMTPEYAKSTAALAANQGLYNLFLVAGLVWGLFATNAEFAQCLQVFFLSCVAIAGIFGGLTVTKRIFILQSVPAFVALGAVLLGGRQ